MNWKEDQLYEFTLSNGSLMTLRFDGFGQWMKPIWFDPATGQTTHQLPPYDSYREV